MSIEPTKGNSSRDRKQRNSRRHQARILTMQIIYESEITGHSTTEILVRTRVQGGTPDETLDYTSALLTGIRARSPDISTEIERAAPDFPLMSIAPIDRALLQIAIFETLFGEDVPPRAAVNEAVDIAREYGGESSSRFINGVMGQIIDRYHPEASRKPT